MKNRNYLKLIISNIILLCLLALPKVTFAAEPLVCVYEGGLQSSSTMLIQSPDGKFSVKTNSDDNAILEDSDWYTPSNDYGVYIEWDSKYYKNEILTDCPAYTRYKFTSRTSGSYYTFYFYDDKTWNHLDYPLNDKHNLEIDENDYMQSFEGNYSSEVSSNEWLKICSYNEEEYSEEIRLYFNRDKMIIAEDSSLIYRVNTDFSLNDVLNYYDRTSGSCPTLYADTNCIASIGNTFCYVEYSMDKSFSNSDEDKPTYNGDDDPDTPVEEEEDEPRLNYNSVCANEGPRKVAKIVGYVIKIAQWLAPLLIIVFGMIEFGKAVVSSDDKSMSKSVSSLIKKIILGVAIFLIPTLITAILNLIQVSNDIEDSSDFAACTKCLFDPFNSCEQQKTGGGGNNTNTHSQK